jgi:hypothetical protein
MTENVAGFVAQQPSDYELAAALGEGLTYAQAGERVGLSERTVQRRMEDEALRDFVATVSLETARARWEIASRRLRAIALKAVDTIEELQTIEASGKPGASTRLRGGDGSARPRPRDRRRSRAGRTPGRTRSAARSRREGKRRKVAA